MMTAANRWDMFAEQVNGKTVRIDGIEYTVRIAPSLFRVGGFSTEIEGIPTANGKRTNKYKEERRKLGDDWSAAWTEKIPVEIEALFTCPSCGFGYGHCQGCEPR